MEVKVFKLPNLNDTGIAVIEKTYCKLLNDYRNGVMLQPEVIDWMDSANNFLITAQTRAVE